MVVQLVGDENGSGNLPSILGLLEVNEPLICSDAVAGLRIVIEDVDGLRNLDLELHGIHSSVQNLKETLVLTVHMLEGRLPSIPPLP